MILFALSLLLVSADLCWADTDTEPFFRHDYRYVAKIKTHYKHHKYMTTWCEAMAACNAEGAELLTPRTAEEAYLFAWSTWAYSWLGIHDMLTEGSFITLNGTPAADIYTNWRPDNRNYGDRRNLIMDSKDCAVMREDGGYTNEDCDSSFRFICTKYEPEVAVGEVHDKAVQAIPAEQSIEDESNNKAQLMNGYKYLAETKTLYKHHDTPRAWCEAVVACKAEGAQLAAPSSADDALALMSLMTDNTWIGVHDLLNEGKFITLNGTPITRVYKKGINTRYGSIVSLVQDCVVMYKDGIYNVDECQKKFLFTCTRPQVETETNYKKTSKDAETAPYFRRDYTYIPEIKAHYKEHINEREWYEAVAVCSAEGAELVAPRTAEEVRVLTEIIEDNTWLGIHDMLTEGSFITLNGTPAADIYTNWRPGEPDDAEGNEDCVVMYKVGEYRDYNCRKKNRFICTKYEPKDDVGEINDKAVPPCPAEQSNEQTAHESNNKSQLMNGYNYLGETKTLYKYHDTPRAWFEAVVACKAEGAELAAPSTADDALALTSLMTDNTWIGIHDLLDEGNFITLNGTPIDRVYKKWNTGEPSISMHGISPKLRSRYFPLDITWISKQNDENVLETYRSNTQDCVVMYRDGTYNDDECQKKFHFVCIKPQVETETDDRKGSKDLYSEEPDPFFKLDYKYDCGSQAFYKEHAPKKWRDAVASCAAEGARLATPLTEQGARALRDRMGEETGGVFLGLRDVYSDGNFVTLNGIPASNIFTNWRQPLRKSIGDCAELSSDGFYDVVKCDVARRFFCQKDLGTLTHNPACGPYSDYHYVNETNRCYKFYKTPMEWFFAYKICSEEGSHLGIINSAAEASVYVNLLEYFSGGTLKGNGHKAIHVGFTDLLTPGKYLTVGGAPFSEAGYEEWANDQPRIVSGRRCGSMGRGGKLGIVECQSQASYFCEKIPGNNTLPVFDERFDRELEMIVAILLFGF